MRILFCTASLNPNEGGLARSVPQLAVAVAKLGVEVGLWSPQPGPAILSDCIDPGGIRRLCGSFAKAWAEFGRPDLVHDNGIWLPLHHQIAKQCFDFGTPRVVSPRGMVEPWALNHRRWKKCLAWHLYQKRDLDTARLLHATSEAELKHLRQLGFKQSSVILPNGVNFAQQDGVFKCTPRNAGLRSALFLGRLHPIKGLDMLVEAWSKVRPRGWKMQVVGPDESGYRQKIQAAVVRMGLSETWSFEDMAEGHAKWSRMSTADLFILPSHSENFGIVVAEALVSGVPVITTTGTPWECLRSHRCGWWTEPTANGIEAALRLATELPSTELAAMGSRGANWARREFAWPAIAGTMIETYRWTINGGARPACII